MSDLLADLQPPGLAAVVLVRTCPRAAVNYCSRAPIHKIALMAVMQGKFRQSYEIAETAASGSATGTRLYYYYILNTRA